MKKVVLILSVFTLFFVSTIQATRATPRVGKSVWRVARDATPTPIENLDTVGLTITIDNPGSYQLYEDITYQILIEASNVSLDLNGYEVASASSGLPSIFVRASSADVDGVHIFNGTVAGTALVGVSFYSNDYTLSNVLLENISISENSAGVSIDSSASGSISNCSFVNIDAMSNNVGYQISTQDTTDAYDLSFYNCRALYTKVTGFLIDKVSRNLFQNCQVYKMVVDANVVDPAAPLRSAGFCLFEASENVLQDCQVIEMEAEETVSAFKSEGCSNNLFENCTVKKIITTAEDFCNKAHGFLLTATEEKTKIIDCVVNEVDMTSTVSAVSYGIHLAPVIESVITASAVWEPGDELLEEIDDYVTTESFATSIAWSPDSRYIAAAGYFGTNSVYNGFVAVYGFDGELLSIIDDPGVPLSLLETTSFSFRDVDWSPDGNFVATAHTIEGIPAGEVSVFEFDGSSLLLTDSIQLAGGDDANVVWSPDGHYIARCGSGFVGIVGFDENKTLREIASYSFGNNDVYEISWSPDQRYLAVGEIENLHVFNFDGRNLILLDSLALAPGNPAFSASWSPNGCFIVTGATSIVVVSFDGTDLSEAASTSISFLTSMIRWSPDGKYLTYVYRTELGDPDRHVQVDSFDGATITPIKWQPNLYTSDKVRGLSWSACGKYIATSSEDTGTGDSALRVFKAMYGPEQCLVRNCSVCDAAAYGTFVGTGIMGAGTNCFFENVACNNEVDFSFGIPNVFYGKHNDHQPFDNVATQRPNFLVKDPLAP